MTSTQGRKCPLIRKRKLLWCLGVAGEQLVCSKRWIQLTTTLYVLIINYIYIFIGDCQVVVSPRNFFLFTPLLPSVAVGTLNTRSIIQSIRYITRHKTRNVSVIEAEATDVDVCALLIIFLLI